MKRSLLWLIAALVLAICFVFYRTRAGSGLNVTPDAEQEIEKAMRR